MQNNVTPEFKATTYANAIIFTWDDQTWVSVRNILRYVGTRSAPGLASTASLGTAIREREALVNTTYPGGRVQTNMRITPIELMGEYFLNIRSNSSMLNEDFSRKLGEWQQKARANISRGKPLPDLHFISECIPKIHKYTAKIGSQGSRMDSMKDALGLGEPPKAVDEFSGTFATLAVSADKKLAKIRGQEKAIASMRSDLKKSEEHLASLKEELAGIKKEILGKL